MEILEREFKTERKNILENFEQMQLSYNSYGHLAIRFFNKLPDVPKDQKRLSDKEKDLLVVFTKGQTEEIKRFLNKLEIC